MSLAGGAGGRGGATQVNTKPTPSGCIEVHTVWKLGLGFEPSSIIIRKLLESCYVSVFAWRRSGSAHVCVCEGAPTCVCVGGSHA